MATSTLTDESVTITVPAECVDGLRRGAAQYATCWSNALTTTYDGAMAVEDQLWHRKQLQGALAILEQIPVETAGTVIVTAPVRTMRETLLNAAGVWAVELGDLLGEGGYFEAYAEVAEAGELGRRIAWAAAECEAVA